MTNNLEWIFTFIYNIISTLKIILFIKCHVAFNVMKDHFVGDYSENVIKYLVPIKILLAYNIGDIARAIFN